MTEAQNDNAGSPIHPDKIPDSQPAMPPEETDVYKQVAALIDVWNISKELRDRYDELDNVLNNPILAGNVDELLTTIAAVLKMALPGSDLYARGIGTTTLEFPDGKKAMGIAMDLFPGKKVIFAMSRDNAEQFEKMLKSKMDEQFGRIILP